MRYGHATQSARAIAMSSCQSPLCLTSRMLVSYSPARGNSRRVGRRSMWLLAEWNMQTQSPRPMICLLALLVLLVGCNSAMLREEESLSKPAIPAVDPNAVQFVNDLTRPWGLTNQEVQGVALIVGLNGTGSDPGPTAERSMLLSDMQTRNVEPPSEVLASPSTAIAMVRGTIPPGARKGDRFDLEVRVPSGSETTSLHSGWLMQTRMREYARLNNRLSGGHVLGQATGDVLTDDLLEGDGDPVFQTRGRVLGGGVIGTTRNLGLVMRDEFTSVKASAQVGRAINRRFHMFHRGNKEGVATPKRDNFVELRVHPRYRDNIVRYVRVIQNIAVRESPAELTSRLELLRSQMGNPTTASLAAVQLESIGEASISVLEDVLQSSNPEIRFYAAEALAYLDQPSAAESLIEAVRDEPAFRWRALAALGAMDDIAAHEALISLLNTDSAETRYGAFRILRKLTPDDPVIRGEALGEKFWLHIVDGTGPPLVHVSKHERPEIVLFGSGHELREPVVVFAGGEIVIRSEPAGGIRLRRLSAGEEDREIQVSSDLTQMIRGIVELGGGYPEVVDALSEAKSTGALVSRLEFSALAETGRVYHRSEEGSASLEPGLGPGRDLSLEPENEGINGAEANENLLMDDNFDGLTEDTLPPMDFLDADPDPDFIVTDGQASSLSRTSTADEVARSLRRQSHDPPDGIRFESPQGDQEMDDPSGSEFSELADPADRRR